MIGRKEGAILLGMLIDVHGYMECPLDGSHWRINVHHHAIGMSFGDGEAIGVGEVDYSLVVRFAETELLSEFEQQFWCTSSHRVA